MRQLINLPVVAARRPLGATAAVEMARHNGGGDGHARMVG